MSLNAGNRRSAVEPSRVQNTPALGNGPCHWQQALLKPLVEIVVKPALQLTPAFAWREALNALADFAKAQDTGPEEIGIGGSEPCGDIRIGITAPFEFRQDVGIKKEPAHNSAQVNRPRVVFGPLDLQL